MPLIRLLIASTRLWVRPLRFKFNPLTPFLHFLSSPHSCHSFLKHSRLSPTLPFPPTLPFSPHSPQPAPIYWRGLVASWTAGTEKSTAGSVIIAVITAAQTSAGDEQSHWKLQGGFGSKTFDTVKAGDAAALQLTVGAKRLLRRPREWGRAASLGDF
ncbi:unnamed protein product [Closterium sp. NIES-64]|nr:unnamed protein product [Closterium sp. NIES-64]